MLQGADPFLKGRGVTEKAKILSELGQPKTEGDHIIKMIENSTFKTDKENKSPEPSPFP